ncbi:hypothetical protein TNCV_1333461 [Trichonephila clavipes]|nr:hypothetical protein TNCV_1333461 [Trichonephila clavipes]
MLDVIICNKRCIVLKELQGRAYDKGNGDIHKEKYASGKIREYLQEAISRRLPGTVCSYPTPVWREVIWDPPSDRSRCSSPNLTHPSCIRRCSAAISVTTESSAGIFLQHVLLDPDLNLCDFWLWRYLSIVYRDPIPSTSNLKEGTELLVRNIPQLMLLSTVEQAILRFQMVADNGRQRIESVL